VRLPASKPERGEASRLRGIGIATRTRGAAVRQIGCLCEPGSHYNHLQSAVLVKRTGQRQMHRHTRPSLFFACVSLVLVLAALGAPPPSPPRPQAVETSIQREAPRFAFLLLAAPWELI
jgi:hypothetical protein